MFKSIHMKLVVILVLLVVSVMAVVGTFLVNSVTSFYISEFRKQISSVFNVEFIGVLNKTATGEDASAKLKEIVSAYSAALGIGTYRNFYILDSASGSHLSGSNDALGKELPRTSNIISAMNGKVGNSGSIIDNFMDIAIPIQGDKDYIVYIKDTKQELQNLTWMLFAIAIQAMLFGLIVAILLSFLLSKTMSNPIENLRRGAQQIASGDFEYFLEVQSNDEIGELTKTFNNMAQVLKYTLEEVREERDKLNTLFLHMTDGVAAFDSTGGIMHMNLAAERIFNVKFTEELEFSDVFCSVDIPEYSMLSQKEYFKADIEKNSKVFTVFFAAFGMADGERGIISVIHDITEQKKLDDSRREFVANVSHELRTPLTNIKGYTETLIDTSDDIGMDIRNRFLSVISSEADRMTRIVKDLLTLSKLDYGKLEVNFSHFSIRQVLNDTFDAMRLEAASHNHEMQLDIDDNVCDVYADKDRIEQVIINILANGIKYTPNGGKIKLVAKMMEDDRLYISVEDNGFGIPREDVPRLFERFYRVDKARSRDKGGTGLGLAIAKEIIDAHSGTIEIESELDVGSKVKLNIPSRIVG